MKTSAADIRSIARQAYSEVGMVERLLALGRPSICPFHVLVDWVPEGTISALDIGCGSGLFVNTLAAMQRIRSALGIDVSERAIAAATAASIRLGVDNQAQFQRHDLAAGLPNEQFDLVTMIDVMHHIPPAAQIDALREAMSRLTPQGTLIYKDMVDRPRWQAMANRGHDLLLAGQWIHYLPISKVCEVAAEAGLEISHQQRIDMFWYGHELVVLTAKV